MTSVNECWVCATRFTKQMEKDQAVWCETLGLQVSVSDSTFHLIAQFLVDGFAGLRTFINCLRR